MITQYLIFGSVGLAIVYGIYTIYWLLKRPAGDLKTQEIGRAIQEGARAYLNKQYKTIAVVAVILAALIYWFISPLTALAFLLGATTSAVAGYIGMNVAVRANTRTAEAARVGIGPALAIAFRAGSVTGFAVVALGLLLVTSFFFLSGDITSIIGLGFGASFISIFARVGGGIYTKAADVGADLVGKVEAGIPEDDPRNPAVIADNVGDNVGDVAGMGADLFESYVGSIIAAMILSASMPAISFVFPLLVAALGIVASLLGVFFVRTSNPKKVHSAMNRGVFAAALIFAVGAYFLTNQFISDNPLAIFWSIIVGLLAGLAIGLATNYFTSSEYRPTREIAEAASTGSATNIISGLSFGMLSTIAPIAVVAAAIILTNWLAGVYGVAIAAVGMLATLGITLSADTYGPVADNAAGIAEMAGLGQEVRERAETLDAVGNTTAAVGKGFAIGSAALTSLALLISYFVVARLAFVNLGNPVVIVGLFIGGVLPFIFSALTMRAVGQAAMEIVQEVRHQFKNIEGLMEGRVKPDYSKTVSIATKAALTKMILPGLLAVVVPLAVGFGFGEQGAEALAGLLIGALVTGFLLAVMMANAGGAWDNAKKYIEAGNLGGKGSDAHKAAVVGDTIGDPFKDTSGPSLNILIKIISIVALIIAPLL